MTVFVLVSFACASITRLIMEDTIAQRLRTSLMLRSRFMARLLACRWCVGWWVSCGVVSVADAVTSVPLVGLVLCGARVGSALVLSLVDAATSFAADE